MPHSDKNKERAWRKSWWASLPTEKKAEKQAKANGRATRLRRYLDEIKISRGCMDCGYNKHPSALDFDHVSGNKERLVSFCKSIAQAEAEIAKCEVRCANCHRIQTWLRKQSCKPDIFKATYTNEDGTEVR